MSRGFAPRAALGLMTGTSMDGVDAALLIGDGERIEAFGASAYRPFAPEERAILRRAATAARSAGGVFLDETVAALVADACAEAAEAAIARSAPGAPRPTLIGFHGQTLHHAPERGVTLQVGDPFRLADRLGVDVIYDFRSADVAAGGQGAPLAPFYHFALARRAGLEEPVAFLNLGGVGNVTRVDPRAAGPEAAGALVAFDTGPANAPLDDLMRLRGHGAYDEDGALAASGRADAAFVARRAARTAYLRARPPKSLDREAFSDLVGAVADLSDADAAATLVAFVAETVAAAAAMLAPAPARWFACGGGRRNRTLLAAIAARLAPAVVEPVEAIGVDGDMLEAQAFAHLALRSLRGLALSAPGTTGAPTPVTGGRLARPS